MKANLYAAMSLAIALCATPAGAIDLIPDADARLANDENRGPDSNVGDSDLWEVRWHSAPRVRIGYVRYDITGVNPGLFGSGILQGTFTASQYNGSAGSMWDVYGLNDDVAADPVAGTLGNEWAEDDIAYENASGVDNGAAIGTFAFTSDVTHLGTITFDGVDEQPLPFSSNPSELDLTDFLSADTDGLVTFLFMDVGQNGDEYRIDSKEGNMADGHGPMTLSFPCLAGDANCDGVIDIETDLAAIADHFRQNVTLREEGDLNEDGFVDFADFDQWKSNYTGSVEGVDFGFLAVPEPGATALVALGATGVLALRRRRSGGDA